MTELQQRMLIQPEYISRMDQYPVPAADGENLLVLKTTGT